jgi:hypothetical protein
MTTIAFDVDYTLINKDNTPNYEVLDLLRWFIRNGDRIVVWSGGGTDYASHWVDKLGLDALAEREGPKRMWMIGVDPITQVSVIAKTIEKAEEWDVDIAVDDEFVKLGKVNIKIKNDSKQ